MNGSLWQADRSSASLGWLSLAARLALVLLGLGVPACQKKPTEPDGDPGNIRRIIAVRGRITTEDGQPVDSTQVAIQLGVNNPDCTGERYTAGLVWPGPDGTYLIVHGIPQFLRPERCVWILLSMYQSSRLDLQQNYIFGGVPGFLKTRAEGPPDTLVINAVLKLRQQ